MKEGTVLLLLHPQSNKTNTRLKEILVKRWRETVNKSKQWFLAERRPWVSFS